MVKEKKIDEKLIDKAVSRVLLAKFRMGLFEDPYGEKYEAQSLHSRENIRVARQIADESTVLLKNDKGLLPLNLSELNSIAVIGPNADQVQFRRLYLEPHKQRWCHSIGRYTQTDRTIWHTNTLCTRM